MLFDWRKWRHPYYLMLHFFGYIEYVKQMIKKIIFMFPSSGSSAGKPRPPPPPGLPHENMDGCACTGVCLLHMAPFNKNKNTGSTQWRMQLYFTIKYPLRKSFALLHMCSFNTWFACSIANSKIVYMNSKCQTEDPFEIVAFPGPISHSCA